MADLGTSLPDFDLPNTHPSKGGARVSRADVAGRPVVVVFTCNHCPYAVAVEPRLIEQARGWIERGVAVVAISSNDAEAYPEDSPEKMAERAGRLDYPFPYLYDASQDVARAFDAACTPDFFLFDAHGALVYRGRLDDGRPARSHTPAAHVTTRDLDTAIGQLLDGGEVTVEQSPSLGCNIKWKEGWRNVG